LRSDLNLHDLVKFMGKRPQHVLPYYYSAADVVVVPSHYESFGMVALEAMACGTPVIASQVGGLAYLVQDGVTGYHIPDKDPVALSNCLMLLLNNHKLNEKLGKQAAEYAKQYAWEKIATKILEVFSDVIKTHSLKSKTTL
jgi:D-inositol-3-phosphate glycosyltransferase